MSLKPAPRRLLRGLASSARSWAVRRPFQQRNARRDDAFEPRLAPLVPSTAEPHVQAWVSDWEAAAGQADARAGIALLRSDVWDLPLRPDLVHRCVVAQHAALKQVHRAGKSRHEVRGGGRKPRPQKGTGKSRQGSIRAPQWRGGGVAFPRQRRDFAMSLPRRVVDAGTKVALSDKLRRSALLLVGRLALDEPKTSALLERLQRLGLSLPHTRAGGGHKVLLVGGDDRSDESQAAARLAAQNIPGVSMCLAKDVSVLKLVSHSVLLLSLDGLRDLESRLGGPAPFPRRTWPPSAVLREWQAAN